MPRYAIIITGDDGDEIVSAIGEFEGSRSPRGGRVEPVAPGVRIGMVRGGPVDAVAGFGFPGRDLDPSAVALATARLKAMAAGRKAAPAAEPARRPPRPKPRGKPARKPGKARAARSPKTSVSDAASHG